MKWRLVREDVLGMADFEWTKEMQREMRLTREQVRKLELGQIVRTALRGGTEFYLAEESEETEIEQEKKLA